MKKANFRTLVELHDDLARNMRNSKSRYRALMSGRHRLMEERAMGYEAGLQDALEWIAEYFGVVIKW